MLGVHLPGDYKEIVARYGSCEIGDAFIVYRPGSGTHLRGPSIEEECVLVGAMLASREQKRPGAVPHRLIVHGGSLLPVARTPSGTFVHLRRCDSGWGIAVDQRNTWALYDLSFSEFLYDALTGILDPPIFGSEVQGNSTVHLL
jgi:hypothetical protein